MRFISILTAILTLLVAVFTFITSFVSLTGIAQEYGFPIPVLLPLTIEAGVIIFSLNAIWRSLNREATRWQWALVILSTSLALTFNILHAQENLISRVMFGIPSLFFLLSFESLISQIKLVTKKAIAKEKKIQDVDSELIIRKQELNKIKEELDTKIKELENLNKHPLILSEPKEALIQKLEEVSQKKPVFFDIVEEAKKPKILTDRQYQILNDIAEGIFSPSALAKKEGVTYQTIYNNLKVLEKENIVSKNGEGWKVNESFSG